MMGCCTEEFRFNNLFLTHRNPRLFVTSQVRCIPAPVYVVYRWMAAIFFVTWLVLSGILEYDWYSKESNKIKWFIYVTDWSFLVLGVDSLLMATLTSYYTYSQKYQGAQLTEMSTLLKVTWVVHNIAINAALAVTVLYFGLLYDPITTPSHNHPVGLTMHAANSIYVIIDLIINATPLRLLHVTHGMLYGATYIVFSVVYHLAGGTSAKDHPYIYSPLDWANASKTSLMAGAIIFLLMPGLWMLLWLCNKLKLSVITGSCHSHEWELGQEKHHQEQLMYRFPEDIHVKETKEKEVPMLMKMKTAI